MGMGMGMSMSIGDGYLEGDNPIPRQSAVEYNISRSQVGWLRLAVLKISTRRGIYKWRFIGAKPMPSCLVD